MSRLRSWTATTKLAAELRGTGAINGALSRQLLQRARDAHGSEATKLHTLARSDSQRVAARALLDSLQQGIARLHGVVQ
jgi:hypothetical protein